MKIDRQAAMDWYSQLEAAVADVPRVQLDPQFGHRYDFEAAASWTAQAHAALSAVFPEGHSIFRQWQAVQDRVDDEYLYPASAQIFESYRGIFTAAKQLVIDDRLGSMIDGVRAETVSEVLDQAEALSTNEKYLVAAAVLAGGALETHLLHLCNRNGLAWKSVGSIGKYNDAVASARKAGNEIYPLTLGKQIGAGAGMRNDAAHDPLTFQADRSDVRRMIDGIRDFIARTA